MMIMMAASRVINDLLSTRTIEREGGKGTEMFIVEAEAETSRSLLLQWLPQLCIVASNGTIRVLDRRLAMPIEIMIERMLLLLLLLIKRGKEIC
jgi:hypothetical protein